MSMKVLILSHNPITDYNSMGKTFLALFETFSPEEVCQFYIYPTLPNVKKCCSYYRITDQDVLKGKRSGHIVESREIQAGNTLYENASDQKLYQNKSSHRELKLACRNLIWKLGRWNTGCLKQWLAGQKPDIIFAAAGASSFFYDVIEKIAATLSIPVVSYVCDDFYFSTLPLKSNGLQKAYYQSLRKKIGKLMRRSARVVTICDALGDDYRKEFGCQTTTVFSGANIEIAKQASLADSRSLVYLGNLQLNRNQSLKEIGIALDELNQAHHTQYRLEIYTGDKDPGILQTFDGVSSIQVKGFVSGPEVHRIMKGACMLIHTESFEPLDVERVRYSMSTKIADSLASGVCLFAYGPAEVASIQHLQSHQCAAVATDRAQLKGILWDYLSHPEKRAGTAEKGIEVANRCHAKEGQSRLLREVFEEVLTDENTPSELCV